MECQQLCLEIQLFPRGFRGRWRYLTFSALFRGRMSTKEVDELPECMQCYVNRLVLSLSQW
eukprot:COSAG02_NODE_1194_length_13955_cov_7.341055_5_plen_61_part_00